MVEIMLSEREKKIFKAIVDLYIEKREPIGSRYIAKHGPIPVSAATIRNIMSDLEERGLITHPYTSAGRIPTDEGFKYYVNELINIDAVNNQISERLKQVIEGSNFESIFERLCNTISELTNSVVFIFEPNISSMVLKHIHFVRINNEKVIAIIVTKTGIVHNVMLNLDAKIKDDELKKISNYLNDNFVGKNLFEIKKHISKQLMIDKEHFDRIMDAIRKGGDDLFKTINKNFVFVAGTPNIIDGEYINDAERLKNLLKSIEEKSFIYNIINKCLNAKEVKLFIGSEIGESILEDYALLTKNYKSENIVGYLGVLGPKSMSYPSVIPIINYTADFLSNLLKQYGGYDDK
ncbi:MAG: heat-inducible transcriptional repressor HrcA [Deferribacterota bacterium]|nr:heat-inducible transcriptional repressor HrcA [Deferribacterota bacterium]